MTAADGKVQFQIDGSKFGSLVTLVNGSATSGSISTLKFGNHTVTASYYGGKKVGQALSLTPKGPSG
jgi:hypothetical protein